MGVARKYALDLSKLDHTDAGFLLDELKDNANFAKLSFKYTRHDGSIYEVEISSSDDMINLDTYAKKLFEGISMTETDPEPDVARLELYLRGSKQDSKITIVDPHISVSEMLNHMNNRTDVAIRFIEEARPYLRRGNLEGIVE